MMKESDSKYFSWGFMYDRLCSLSGTLEVYSAVIFIYVTKSRSAWNGWIHQSACLRGKKEQKSSLEKHLKGQVCHLCY